MISDWRIRSGCDVVKRKLKDDFSVVGNENPEEQIAEPIGEAEVVLIVVVCKFGDAVTDDKEKLAQHVPEYIRGVLHIGDQVRENHVLYFLSHIVASDRHGRKEHERVEYLINS